MNLIVKLSIVLYGVSIITLHIAGLAALLLLMSLVFRLSILLMMRVIIQLGR